MWTRGELDPFLLHAMESFYRYTTGPVNYNSHRELYKNFLRIDISNRRIPDITLRRKYGNIGPD